MDLKPATFIPTPLDQLPRDDAKNKHRGWKFKTLEHNEFNAPEAIEATDRDGRSAVYVLIEHKGTIGRWK